MYELIDIIKNVKSYVSKEGKLAYINDKGLNLEDQLIVPNVTDLFTLHNDSIFYIQNSSTYYNSKQIEKSILIDSLNRDFAVFSSNFNVTEFTLHYELINLKDQKVLIDFGQQPIIRSIEKCEDNLYIHFDNRIIALSISKCEIFWERIGNHKRILGIFKNQLLVAESDHNIQSINCLSGNLTYEWNKVLGFSAGTRYRDQIPNSNNFKVDSLNSKLIGTFHTYYFEIDLKTNKVSYNQLEKEFSKYGLSDFRPFFKNPDSPIHLFMTTHTYLDEFPNVDLSSLIALNKKTKILDWVHTFKESGLGTNTPTLSTNKLYQLDTEKNLHIFTAK